MCYSRPPGRLRGLREERGVRNGTGGVVDRGSRWCTLAEDAFRGKGSEGGVRTYGLCVGCMRWVRGGVKSRAWSGRERSRSWCAPPWETGLAPRDFDRRRIDVQCSWAASREGSHGCADVMARAIRACGSVRSWKVGENLISARSEDGVCITAAVRAGEEEDGEGAGTGGGR